MRYPRIIVTLSFAALIAVVLLVIGVALDREIVARSSLQAENGLAARCRLAARIAPEPPWRPGPELSAALRELSVTTGARVMLVDADGEVAADSAADRPWARGPTELQSVIARALEHSTTTRRSERLGISLVHAAAPVEGTGAAGTLLLTAPWDPGAQLRRELRFFLLASLGVSMLVAWLISARLVQPVHEALERIRVAADAVRGGDLSARVREVTPGPMFAFTAAVNEAIDHLAGRLAAAESRGYHYAAILDQMTDAVVAVDQRGRVRFVNRAFARLFGVEPDDAEGEPLENVTLNYELSALVQRALDQDTVQRAELQLSHPTPHTLQGVATPLADDRGGRIGAVGLLHDITGLRETTRIRQDFVANASHELRTPAASIKALAEALQAGAVRDSERGPRFLQQIVDAADRLTDILDDMLTLTRVERGARLLDPRMVDAAGALEDAVAQVAPSARAGRVQVAIEAEPDLQVHADEQSLHTLLVNLLDNAVKFTGEGGRVAASARRVPGGVELTVADTGIGIPVEEQERIFERFYRVDRARTRDRQLPAGGTGLGLSIVRHIAEAHAGRVSVRSAPGEGSTFTAFFPDPPES